MQANHLNYHNDAQTPCSSMSSWYPDSGATHHVTPDLSALSIANDYNGTDGLFVGNGKSLPITHYGNSSLSTIKSPLVLRDVLRVPSITKPLLFVQKLCRDNNCFVKFHPSSYFVKDRTTKETLLSGKCELGLYRLQGVIHSSLSQASAYVTNLERWHARLGHPNYSTVRTLIKQFHLPCSSCRVSLDKCEACCLGKLHRVSLPLTNNRCSQPLELINLDL